MTQKLIAGFFVLIFMSNYFNFLGFYKILEHLPGAPGNKLRERTRWYFIAMNCLYAATLLLAFIPRFGPTCTSDKVYPPCMNWVSCLFIINFIFHCVISCRKNYFFSEGSIADGDSNYPDYVNAELAEIDNNNQASDSSSVNSKTDLNWTNQTRADKLMKKMFKKQMNIYLWF